MLSLYKFIVAENSAWIGNVALYNMKDKPVWIRAYDDDGNVAETLVTLTNFAEVKSKTNTKGEVINPTSEKINSIDAKANSKGAVIHAGEYVRNIFAGKGVDTIYVGTNSVDINSGAGADYIVIGDESKEDTESFEYNNYNDDYKYIPIYLSDISDKVVLSDGFSVTGAYYNYYNDSDV